MGMCRYLVADGRHCNEEAGDQDLCRWHDPKGDHHSPGTAEALALGVKEGLDPGVLSTIMGKSSGNNWSLERYNPWPGVMENAPASRGYEGGFMTRLMVKDLGLAMALAEHAHSAVPMGALARNLFNLHASQGRESKDFSSILDLYLDKSQDKSGAM